MQYDFQDFSVDLSEAIEIECFDNKPHYYGVIFKVDGIRFKYQIIHNLLLGYRLHIYDGEGYMRDIPLHKGTLGLLPDRIKIRCKTNENLV